MGFFDRFRAADDHHPFASVLFPGGLPPRPEELGSLTSGGINVERQPDRKDAHWSLRLVHPSWGSATVVCPRDPVLPPSEIVEPCLNLMPEEKDAIISARSMVGVRLNDTTQNILADRKRLLRFARAVMDEYGAGVGDHFSWLFWSRQSLEEELKHDADLDVSALYVLHCVDSEDKSGRVGWLHSHGLAEIGFFDFDIVAPSTAVLGRGTDLLRAIAFAIVEGTMQPSMGSYTIAEPGGVVSVVEAAEFARRANREALALWGADEDHRARRSVLCEPRTGVLRRLFDKVTPSKFLSLAEPDQLLIQFSERSTSVMAARAKATYGVLRALFQEFRELNLPVLVKCGLPTDHGGETDREHLWFSVNELRDDAIEATLDNQPFDVSAMRAGDRGTLALNLLSDWCILTPAGSITPANMTAVRAVRERRDEIRKMMDASSPG